MYDDKAVMQNGINIGKYSDAPVTGLDKFGYQVRNIIASDRSPAADPGSAGKGIDGDLWIQYS